MSGKRPMQPHWVAMKAFDGDLYEKCAAWRDGITYNEVIPLKQKEIMMVAMCCLIRFEAGLRTHVEYALAEGVTKENCMQQHLWQCFSVVCRLSGMEF